MLVWHIDFDLDIWLKNAANNDPDHQRVDLMEADNTRSNDSRAGDSFPGVEGITSFTDTTMPALVDWSGNSFGVGLYDISESEEGVISFTLRNPGGSGIYVHPMENGSLVRTVGDSVYAVDGSVTIYDMSGRRIKNIGRLPVVLNPGIYVAVAQGRNQKFIVR